MHICNAAVHIYLLLFFVRRQMWSCVNCTTPNPVYLRQCMECDTIKMTAKAEHPQAFAASLPIKRSSAELVGLSYSYSRIALQGRRPGYLPSSPRPARGVPATQDATACPAITTIYAYDKRMLLHSGAHCKQS